MSEGIDEPGSELNDTLPKKEHRRSAQFLTSFEMTSLGIPSFLQHAYLNGIPPPSITKLRPWQQQLLQSDQWNSRQNCIILVPTSGGKTVAADVAIAQILDCYSQSKILYALPFVSLASEKLNEFRKRFPDFQVRPFYQNIGGNDFRRGHVAVCTYEKVNTLLNFAVKDGYIAKFQLIVIDEIHMIGDPHRGPVIEAILTKILLLKDRCHIRIIGLSATLTENDANQLAEWIGGFAFFCSARPSRIKHFLKTPNGSLWQMENGEKLPIEEIHSIPNDRRQLLPLIRTELATRSCSTILIFVNTRKQAVQVAVFVARHLNDHLPNIPPIPTPRPQLIASRELVIQQLTKVDTGLDQVLAGCIQRGVAFHHAGLLLEERKLIEDAGRNSTISVIVATTNLSAEINIRSVSRVLVYGIYRSRQELIPASVYTQMAGRVGRDELYGGEVYVLACSDEDQEIEDALQLAKQEMKGLESHFNEGSADRYFLECLVFGICFDVSQFVQSTFESFLSQGLDFVVIHSEQILRRLQELCLLFSDTITPTSLGEAIATSSLSIEEGLDLKASIDNLQTTLCLCDDVHYLYLCVPISTIASEETPPYDHNIWQMLIRDHQQVLALLTHLDFRTFESHIVMTLTNGGKQTNRDKMAKIDEELDRLFFACLLQRLITEQSITELGKLFCVTRGSIQSLQMRATNFASQTVRFCERVGSRTLARTLSEFQERLNFGCRNELLPLMKLPSCRREIARILVENRVSGPVELSELSSKEIVKLLTSKEMPSDQERDLAEKLKSEAMAVARSMIVIEDFELSALIAKFNDWSIKRQYV